MFQPHNPNVVQATQKQIYNQQALKNKGNAVSQHISGGARGRGGLLLLIHDLSIRYGWVVSVTLRPRFTPGKGSPVHSG
jgi:hypothetical protein